MITTETIVTLAEAARRLPPIGGRRPHVSTVWRWARRGLPLRHGRTAETTRVYLEHRRMGRRIVTSLEALERFAAAAAEIMPPLPTPRRRPPRERSSPGRGRDDAR